MVASALTFGQRVEAARRRGGLTQRDLGAVSGLSASTINRVETAKKSPSIPELLKIAAGLGTTLGALTGESPVRDRLTFAARTTNDATAEDMKDRLAYYLEMDAHFEEFGHSTSA